MKFTVFPERPAESYRKCDSIFIVAIMLMWGLGVYCMFTLTQDKGLSFFGDKYYFFKRHLISSVIGFCSFLFFAFIPLRIIKKWSFGFLIISFVLCILVFMPGIGSYNRSVFRWIHIGSFSFQPSEAVKFFMIIYFANLMDKNEDKYYESPSEIWVPIGFLLFFSALICAQKDFSTTVVFFLSIFFLLFLSNRRKKWILFLLAIIVPLGIYAIVCSEYRLGRIIGFINQLRGNTDIRRSGETQSYASLRAVSSGRFWGNGSGSNLVTNVPEIQTDYIFAGWASSMGLLGILGYLGLLGIFAWRSVKIALETKNRFASFATFGIAFCIVLQSLLNCAVVCSIVPSTGIPLPFFSFGGSSLIMTFAMCGFIVNTSYSTDEDGDEGPVNKKDSMNEVVFSDDFDSLVVEYE